MKNKHHAIMIGYVTASFGLYFFLRFFVFEKSNLQISGNLFMLIYCFVAGFCAGKIENWLRKKRNDTH